MDFLKNAELVKQTCLYQIENRMYQVTKTLTIPSNLVYGSIVEVNDTQFKVTHLVRNWNSVTAELTNEETKITQTWPYSDSVFIVFWEEV